MAWVPSRSCSRAEPLRRPARQSLASGLGAIGSGGRAGRAKDTATTRGFTLVEILVALTIVAVALMASLRAVGSLTVGADDLRKRTLALWSAENTLAQIRIERGPLPPVGKRSFACDQGNLKLRCDQIVQTSANPFFRRVDVQVFEAGREGAYLARLIGFATTVR